MTLKKLDHGFKNDALSYDASPNYQPCVKLSFFFNKKPEVSDEQFHRSVTLDVCPQHLLIPPPIELKPLGDRPRRPHHRCQGLQSLQDPTLCAIPSNRGYEGESEAIGS